MQHTRPIFYILVFITTCGTANAASTAECMQYTDCDMGVACELYQQVLKELSGQTPDWNGAAATAILAHPTECGTYPEKFKSNILTETLDFTSDTEKESITITIDWSKVKASVAAAPSGGTPRTGTTTTPTKKPTTNTSPSNPTQSNTPPKTASNNQTKLPPTSGTRGTCFTKDTQSTKRFSPPTELNGRVYWWIGDSRFTGMYINKVIGNKGNEGVIANAGKGHQWLTQSPTPTGLSLLKSCVRGGDVVILNLGANDITNYNKYISTYSQLIKDYPNVTFKMVSVNPVYDGKARLKNSSIETFNTHMKNAFPANFIDTYSVVKPMINAGNTDAEGLHYRGGNIEKTIYNTIMSSFRE